MSYTFTQMMTELDPNHTFTQLKIDVCYNSWFGTFGTHQDWDNPDIITPFKGILNVKLSQIVSPFQSAIYYSTPVVNDTISHVSYPAPTYVATWVA